MKIFLKHFFSSLMYTFISVFLFFLGFAPFLYANTAQDISPEEKKRALKEFCNKVNKKFNEFKWRKIICNADRWDYDTLTANGNPLLYKSFQNGPTTLSPTLVMCVIHGDEPSTAYLCIQLVRDIFYDNPKKYEGLNIVVAPFINPDSFLNLKVRPNASGVDLNRNFPTKDWEELAHKLWGERQGKNSRRFPGNSAASEAETLFQMQLIEKFKPSKILSIHAPYGFLDYDISSDAPKNVQETVKKIALEMGKRAQSFRVVDFSVFPGSLGNYAGMEKLIPTYTLELQSSRSGHGYPAWRRFQNAIHYLIQSELNLKEEKLDKEIIDKNNTPNKNLNATSVNNVNKK